MLVNLNPGHFPSLTDHPYHYSQEVMDVELMTTETKMKASRDEMKLNFLLNSSHNPFHFFLD